MSKPESGDASSAALQALGVVRTPRTETLRELGKGGVGRVEAVYDHVLGRTAAKKTLLPQHADSASKLRRFVREARITSQLDHPNIVPVHDLAVDAAGRPYFELKLVRGKTLMERIDTWRDIGVEEGELLDVLDCLVKVCDALSLAHSRDVIHCDVKPDNIMIGDHGETYLMDWGAALVLPENHPGGVGSRTTRLLTPRPALPGDSVDETIGGTPNYMAPEQANGEADLIDRRTDVFGVGATLYEVLTGRSPYDDVDDYLAIEFAEKGHYLPLAELIEAEYIPPLLERVINRSMAREPGERYEDIDALKADLVRYIRGGSEFPVVRIEPGTVVVHEGDAADRAYIIARGHCEVVKDLDGERRSVRVLGPGEVFGETALLSPGPRTASVVALDDVSLQVIQPDVLGHELDSTRPWLSRLVRTVAQRFREMDASSARSRAQSSEQGLAMQSVMLLTTFGAAGADGVRSLPWSTLCRELADDDAGRVTRLRAALDSVDGVHVDPESNQGVLRDPARAVAAVAPGLEA